MRPGRFDVEIYVNKPDYLGRKEILDLYLSRILTHEVDTVYLARCTTGFTGADLENMVRKILFRNNIYRIFQIYHIFLIYKYFDSI